MEQATTAQAFIYRLAEAQKAPGMCGLDTDAYFASNGEMKVNEIPFKQCPPGVWDKTKGWVSQKSDDFSGWVTGVPDRMSSSWAEYAEEQTKEAKGVTVNDWKAGFVKNFTELNAAFWDKDKAAEMWRGNFIFLKVFGGAFLVAMVIVNYYLHGRKTGLITEKPNIFVIESLVFAACSVIPFVFVWAIRSRDGAPSESAIETETFAKQMAWMFVIFFVLNFLLELSGLYALAFGYGESDTDPEPTTPKPTDKPDNLNEFEESFFWTSGLYLGIGFVFCLFVIGIFVPLRVRNSCYFYKPEWAQSNLGSMGLFFIEMLVVGAVSAVPIYLMAMNRDRLSTSHTSLEFGLIAAKFCVLHVVLQMSGFYNFWLRGEKPSQSEAANKCNGVFTILPMVCISVGLLVGLYQYRKKYMADEEAEKKKARDEAKKAERHQSIIDGGK